MAVVPTVKDILAKVTAEKTIDDGIATAVTSIVATLADLRQQLATAIANNDPTTAQAVLDQMAANEASLNSSAAALSQAIQANVPTS